MPVIYTTPVSRADGADVVMLPTDLSAETGVPPLTNGIEGTPEAGFPDEIAPRPEDYVFLKRRPSAFYGTGVAELLHMLRRDAIIIGGGATNRGVETSVREAFNLDLASVVVRECCWSGDAAAHAYSLDKAMKMYARIRTPRPGRGDAAGLRRTNAKHLELRTCPTHPGTRRRRFGPGTSRAAAVREHQPADLRGHAQRRNCRSAAIRSSSIRWARRTA